MTGPLTSAKFELAMAPHRDQTWHFSQEMIDATYEVMRQAIENYEYGTQHVEDVFEGTLENTSGHKKLDAYAEVCKDLLLQMIYYKPEEHAAKEDNEE